MGEAIQEVILAEERAKKLLEQAELSKQKILEEGRRKAIQIISEKQTKSDKKRDVAVEKKKEELEKQKKKILEKADEEAKILKKKAMSNLSKATDWIVKEFEKVLR